MLITKWHAHDIVSYHYLYIIIYDMQFAIMPLVHIYIFVVFGFPWHGIDCLKGRRPKYKLVCNSHQLVGYMY